MNINKILIISIVITSSLGQSLFGRYGEYVTYFVQGFTPPLSFFRERPFPFDPQKGESYHPAFRNAYGEKGEKLVRAYGHGFSKELLLQHGLL